MLLRLAYLGLTNAFALLRLLPMTDQDKDIEILVLRHQNALLQRQLGDTKVRFSPTDRALLMKLPEKYRARIWEEEKLMALLNRAYEERARYLADRG